MDIALRWSARRLRLFIYRHIAPLEQRGMLRNKDPFTPEAWYIYRERMSKFPALQRKIKNLIG